MANSRLAHSQKQNPPDRRTIASETIQLTRKNLEVDVLNSVGECVYEWDMQTDALHWNEGASVLLCVENLGDISSGRNFNRLLLATTDSTRNDKILSSREIDDGRGVAYRLQYALSAKQLNTSSDIWIEDTGRWFAGQDGKPNRAHGVIRIINERRNLEERLDHLARFDQLTGLFNRDHLNLCLEKTFVDIEKTGEQAAFLVVGLEQFELVNSVFGYAAGDEVIVEVAKRIKENLRDNDIIGRFSGEKIGIILPECNEHDMLVAGYRILNVLRENVVKTDSGPIAVTVAVGGVVVPQHARTPREAFMAAHQALNESRRAREASLVSFRPNPEKEAERARAAKMAQRIVLALKERRIHLAWQPVVDSSTHEVAFHEALIRLHDDDGTVLQAGDFVEVAQGLGLIRMIDHYALDLALEMLVKAPTAQFSLNVSNETACDPEWLSKLAKLAHQHPTATKRLIVEITESHAAESLEEARRFINNVKDLGCKVALDDFGAGFTSFRNLKNLPFDIIKIDGQFADNLSENSENRAFIRALVDIAKLFNAKTVVEWVEDRSTGELLCDWGVDYLQGFKFGTPERELPWPVENEKA